MANFRPSRVRYISPSSLITATALLQHISDFFCPPRRQARALAIGQSHRMIDEDPQLIGSNQMLLGPYVVGQRSYGTPFWVSIALF